jgi:hypothetical protein
VTFSQPIESSKIPVDKTRYSFKSTVCCEDRWQVYHRLQELEMSCHCAGFQPLTVDIETVTEAIQLWSVAKRISQSRQDLAGRLTQSWQLPCHRAHTRQ